jgi:NOL1/NOP2/sun family putative RNA methylase
MKTPQAKAQDIPKAFLDRMAVILGEEFDEFRSSLYQPASLGIRVNTLKISPQAFINISPNKLLPIPWCASGFTIDTSNLEIGFVPPGKRLYHNVGLYYIQEPSAMAAGELLSPQPGEKILDLAAAPGGKSTHLAALMKNTGLLVANEIHPKRVWDLAENLERCGVTNSVVMNESPQRLAEHFNEFFDRVMLDAPCSGEGMFRKNVSARIEWEPESPHSCAVRQIAILDQASRMVKPGGCIAYTTCTFSTEENEGVIARFLEDHPEFDLKIIDPVPGLIPSKPEWTGLPKDHKISRTMRIWPHRSSGEGHFIGLLIKDATKEYHHKKTKPKNDDYRRWNKPKETSKALNLLDGFARTYLNLSFEDRCIYLEGSYIYCIPEGSPSMQGLKVIHPGWWLGSIRNDRFSPSHALAMGIKAAQANNSISLNLEDREVSAYFNGESFTNIGENGWVLVTLEGYPIGWGKRAQNVIKNFYPHGLRRSA